MVSGGGLSVIGARSAGMGDIYYFLVSGSWVRLMGAFVAAYLVLNLFFGTVYFLFQGVGNARPDSFIDHFSFSVQTFATIGYGAMYPSNTTAHLLVTVEAMFGILYAAVATGLVFAKFSRPRSRVLFSDVAVIAPRDGVPTLMFRVANERSNHIVEANLRVFLIRNEVTIEGESIRRMHDLKLVRSSSPAFILTWTVMHPITPDSPLHGATPESLARQGAEIVVTLSGLDDSLGQTIHARHSFLDTELHWNMRMVDIIRVQPDGRRVVDLHRFHDVEPLPPPKPGAGASA
ncbi:ion channel [Hyalangium sp.]|uniref:ion channel n=1 Tax=Hyalangium sp. TaxID=2028555 RepID=UPI00389AC2C3